MSTKMHRRCPLRFLEACHGGLKGSNEIVWAVVIIVVALDLQIDGTQKAMKQTGRSFHPGQRNKWHKTRVSSHPGFTVKHFKRKYANHSETNLSLKMTGRRFWRQIFTNLIQKSYTRWVTDVFSSGVSWPFKVIRNKLEGVEHKRNKHMQSEIPN